jgi:hypothetical protein
VLSLSLTAQLGGEIPLLSHLQAARVTQLHLTITAGINDVLGTTTTGHILRAIARFTQLHSLRLQLADTAAELLPQPHRNDILELRALQHLRELRLLAAADVWLYLTDAVLLDLLRCMPVLEMLELLLGHMLSARVLPQVGAACRMLADVNIAAELDLCAFVGHEAQTPLLPRLQRLVVQRPANLDNIHE